MTQSYYPEKVSITCWRRLFTGESVRPHDHQVLTDFENVEDQRHEFQLTFFFTL